MGIDLLLALIFAAGAWAMAWWVSVEVSQTPVHNRLQSRINLGLTAATQVVYVLLVQTVGTWRDALLLVSVVLLLAWYAMLGLSKAVSQNTKGARGHLFQRLELRGHRAFAFAALVLMGLGALLGLFDPFLALTLTLPLVWPCFAPSRFPVGCAKGPSRYYRRAGCTKNRATEMSKKAIAACSGMGKLGIYSTLQGMGPLQTLGARPGIHSSSRW